MTARVVAAFGVAAGVVAWLVVMVRMNPGSQWFWSHDSSRTLYKSLATLFEVGVTAVAAHMVALSLLLQWRFARGWFWPMLVLVVGGSGTAGLAVYTASANPKLAFAPPLLIPTVTDAVGVVLICLAWWLANPRPSTAEESWFDRPVGLRGLEMAAVIVPLGIGLLVMQGWLDIVFDESMGPDDSGVVLLAAFVSMLGWIYVRILIAMSRRRLAEDEEPEPAHSGRANETDASRK